LGAVVPGRLVEDYSSVWPLASAEEEWVAPFDMFFT
jgi:hypothetical protein